MAISVYKVVHVACHSRVLIGLVSPGPYETNQLRWRCFSVKCSIFSGGSKMSGSGSTPTKPVPARPRRRSKPKEPSASDINCRISKHSSAVLRVDG